MIKTNKVDYRFIKKTGILIAVACFIAGMLLLVASIRATKEPLVFRSTVKPETFTELYFGDYLSLPSKIIYYQENKFDFIIHNLENEDMEYS